MYIKKIILNNFKRFALKGVTHFELEPSSKLIIFTDKNGAGKSSLMSQLNPLPVDLKKDFYPGGYKVIEIEHNSKSYIITSKDGKHSIIEDGVELNPGGTKRVQQEIVESIFKLNSHTLNVVNGVTRFTIMSPSERKQWLTKISTIDYTYPISIFNKIAERKRDLSAWFKLSNEKMVNLKAFLDSNSNVDELIKREKELQETIESLLRKYNQINRTYSYETVVSNLNNINASISSIKLEEDLDIDKINLSIDKIKASLSLSLSEREKLYSEYDKINKTIDNEIIVKLKEKEESLLSELKHYPFPKIELNDVYIDTLNNLAYRVDKIHSKFLNLNITTEYASSITSDNYNLKLKEIENIQSSIYKIKALIDSSNNTFSVIKSISSLGDDVLKCDNCGSPFKITKFVEVEKDKRERLTSGLESYTSKLEELNKEKRIMESVLDITKEYNYLYSNNSELLSNIDIKSINISNAVQVLNVINITTGKLSERYKSIIRDYDKVKDLIKETEVMNKMSAELKKKEKEAIELKIETLTKDINSLNGLLKYSEDIKNKFNKLTDYRNQLLNELGKLKPIKENMIKENENILIEKLVTSAREELLGISQSLEKYRTGLKTLEEERKNAHEYDKQISYFNTLLQILSPSSGLIAKSINSFLGVIINEMNSIINSVWSYKMKLLPCDLGEGEDLDYKFKVEVNDDFIVDDISKLSSSMQEIVDLSFRLVFIRYLNVGDVPIILDEFGRAMDREHRINAFNMVDQIISHSFDQIFLVSHFEEMYGRFKNAQFASIE